MAPQALRDAGLEATILELGHEFLDKQDLVFPTHEQEMAKAATSSENTNNSENMDINNISRLRYAPQIGEACRQICEAVEEVATDPQAFCLTLGGDHSVAFGSIQGILRTRPNFGLVWVDAHGDFNTPDTSPSGNLHGMPLAALVGYVKTGLPHFEWLERGPHLDPKRVALLGVRSLDTGEKRLLREAGISVFTMKDIDRYGIGRIMEQVLEVVGSEGRPIHVSFDIDSMDPQEAPGTGTRVRGGLTYREAHYILESLADTKQLGSMDLVEINPVLDLGNQTSVLGVELVASALGKGIY
jgi:arginase